MEFYTNLLARIWQNQLVELPHTSSNKCGPLDLIVNILTVNNLCIHFVSYNILRN